jgi:hypothetical protein
MTQGWQAALGHETDEGGAGIAVEQVNGATAEGECGRRHSQRQMSCSSDAGSTPVGRVAAYLEERHELARNSSHDD